MLKEFALTMKTHNLIRTDTFHLDEYLLFNFCVNTSKAFSKDLNKFILFKKHLNCYHNIEEIYEESFEEYSNFLVFQIIKDALLRNSSILTYEQYLYNVLTSFSKEKFGDKSVAKNIAKIWNNLIRIFSTITDISSRENVKEIQYFPTLLTVKKHINVKRMKSNYHFTVPIFLVMEDGFEVVNITPKLKQNTILNIVNQELISIYGNKLKRINSFELGSSLDYSHKVIEVSNHIVKSVNKVSETDYIDFNKVNNNNCNICPLSCSFREILYTRYEPMPHSPKRTTIKVHNL